jgi:hypothetical protein
MTSGIRVLHQSERHGRHSTTFQATNAMLSVDKDCSVFIHIHFKSHSTYGATNVLAKRPLCSDDRGIPGRTAAPQIQVMKAVQVQVKVNVFPCLFN